MVRSDSPAVGSGRLNESKPYRSKKTSTHHVQTDKSWWLACSNLEGHSNKAGADELLERELRSGLMQKPTKRNFRSLVNHLWNRAPIVRSEMKFLKHRDDFVMLTGQSESPLERTLDRVICRVPFAWFRVRCAPTAKANSVYHALTPTCSASLPLKRS
jgi:hypothetical protein